MSETHQTHHPISDAVLEDRRNFTSSEVRTILLDALRPLATYMEAFRNARSDEGTEEHTKALVAALPVARQAYDVANELHTWYGYEQALPAPLDEIFITDCLGTICGALEGVEHGSSAKWGQWIACMVRALYEHVRMHGEAVGARGEPVAA